MKRVTFEVRYNKTKGLWFVFRNKAHVFATGYEQKNIAVEDAAEAAEDEWLGAKTPTELIIKTKAGTIGKGSSSRRSYGLDPKGKKG